MTDTHSAGDGSQRGAPGGAGGISSAASEGAASSGGTASSGTTGGGGGGSASSQAIPALAPSAWSPLRQATFRSLWIASIVSNIGTWMHEVGAAWLMLSLTPSPLFVSLLQTAVSLPVFLLALPSGALADMIDRRRLLLFTQTWMLVSAASLGALTYFQLMTPWLLLSFTFSLGLGAALNMPVWQAIVPELVSRRELPAAAALSGVSMNLARAVGPALGGLIVAAVGSWAVFLLNAVSYLAVCFAVYRWDRPVQASVLPAERLLGAIRAGMRYVRHSPELRALLVRVSAFVSCASAVWALLPVVGRVEVGLSALGYGILLGCLGLGAVCGAALLSKLRRLFSIDTIVAGATLVWGAVALVTAFARHPIPLGAAIFVGGMAWMTFMASLNAAVQTAVPSWVRARALAIYSLTFMGCMAIGGGIWGTVAAYAGTPLALGVAAGGSVLSLATMFRYRLHNSEALDLSPSKHWPSPALAIDPDHERGPVLITVEYCVEPARWDTFVKAMEAIKVIRRRDGALLWGLFQDASVPDRWLESFVVESWLEHLRQHQRVTAEDRKLEQRARECHQGDRPPVVRHLIAPRLVGGKAAMIYPLATPDRDRRE